MRSSGKHPRTRGTTCTSRPSSNGCAVVSNSSSKRSVHVTPPEVDPISRRGGTASSRLRSLNRVWGALLFSRFQKRSGTLNFVPGRLPQRLNGLQQAHPCRGTRLGNAPDRGSRILACISRSVSIIPMVGLQVSLIWSSGGTETFGLLTSSQGRPVPHSLRHSSINSGFTPGCGMRPTTVKR